MNTSHTPETLQAFEADIADHFNAGMIRAPVHLSGGNEEILIEIFKDIRPQDWVLTTWRSHYHCLLKGVPEATLRADILAGKSITLTYPDYRIVSSAIVGGICPIAVGIALSLKRYDDAYPSRGRDIPQPRVWCFVGDMAAHTGVFVESVQYADGHDLPVKFIVEDNGLSVATNTKKAWGAPMPWMPHQYVQRYGYTLPWPHAGAGKRINF